MRRLISAIIAISLSFSLCAHNIVGTWNGTLKVQGIELAIVFHIEEAEDGVKATMDSPDQQAFGIPVTSIEFHDPELKLEIANLAIAYQGKLENSNEISGHKSFLVLAEAALDYLKTRVEINQDHTGIIGHSEGGVIASMIASRNHEISFIVLMAGPALRGDKLLLLQKKNIESQMGINEVLIETNQQIFEGAYDIILKSKSNNSTLNDSLSDYFISKYGAALPENQLKDLINQLSNPWMVDFIRLDPAQYLQKVTCPVLVLYGDKDLQVPSKENLEAIKSILEESGNTNVETREFQGLNHLFQECKSGLPTEYGEIEQTISPLVLEDITKWIVVESLHQ